MALYVDNHQHATDRLFVLVEFYYSELHQTATKTKRSLKVLCPSPPSVVFDVLVSVEPASVSFSGTSQRNWWYIRLLFSLLSAT